MKLKYLIFILILNSSLLNAQNDKVKAIGIKVNLSNGKDLIIKRDGEIITAKIIEVQITEIKYKENGKDLSIPKSEVLSIKLENGFKEVFPIEKKIDTSKIVSGAPKEIVFDEIIMKSGNDIKCRITELNLHEIKYLLPNDTSLKIIKKTDALLIKYSTGAKDLLSFEDRTETKQIDKTIPLIDSTLLSKKSTQDLTMALTLINIPEPDRMFLTNGNKLEVIVDDIIGNHFLYRNFNKQNGTQSKISEDVVEEVIYSRYSKYYGKPKQVGSNLENKIAETPKQVIIRKIDTIITLDGDEIKAEIIESNKKD